MKLTLPLLAVLGVAAGVGIGAYRMNDQSALAAPTQVAAKKAPELVGGPWLNTPAGKPISLANRKGKVTVVEFWTFGCSNCRANLPAYAKWHDQFKGKGVEIIGVHTPEFDSEKKLENVKAQVKKLGIEYPVLLDNQNQNWRNWNQRYWPTVYLVDKAGKVRAKWEGELDYNGASGSARMTKQIEALLAEPAPANASTSANVGAKVKQINMKTSETKEKFEVTKTDEEWRRELTPQQYNVLRQAGTEAPFTGQLLKNHETGIYQCAACGQDLFKSDTKFDSGTGWPSFYDALPGAITEHTDVSFGMKRVETVCSRCGGHLGHVFEDGPKPTGLRYCMNSAALKFEEK